MKDFNLQKIVDITGTFSSWDEYIYTILKEKPETRCSDRLLVLAMLEKYQPDILTKSYREVLENYYVPIDGHISRRRAEIQKVYPELKPKRI